jgi:hypothetical protein
MRFDCREGNGILHLGHSSGSEEIYNFWETNFVHCDNHGGELNEINT